ncbi:alpha/beta fold hydrolase [Nonomuraea turcica]|uniref:alpha/beta fold hydrolase n=1 Tax=Nonomuraea sp. G32 TaxID=3067274 RepID=UPI00273B99D1|nr:alpha/beta fold hydrolase [Nonomuraea sp. G32]MDP4502293.1 alpha/beta fold hydrolase [Nonomuraea sp. G32]
MNRHALVFGASGFIGRHVILALDQAGVRVTAATRDSGSFARLSGWLAAHGCRAAVDGVRVDFDAPALIDGDGDDVTEIYNCAGAYRFGMTVAEARRANVDSVRAIVSFAARLPRLRRLVHVSGYRVGGQDPATVPWSDELVRQVYQRVGAYEGSKMEADAVLRALADQLGVPWSIVNPSSVIGVSTSGESDQQLGLAATLKDIWRGSVAALPGDTRTFVPVIPVDYLARFMTLLPEDPAAARAAFWILDDDTPPLPDLLSLVGRHYQVKVPRLRVPVPVIRRLPAALTKADPETLTFMSSDRYPTGPAREFAGRHGLELPDTAESILRWADHLAAHRFGGASAEGPARRFTRHAGVRTFGIGDPGAPVLVLPGLPVNTDTWAPVAAALGHARVVDLPGLGLSAGRPRDLPAWLAALVEETGPAHLIGHSLGAAAAVEAGLARPDRVEQLTLVSPFFLQAGAPFATRLAPLTRLYLRRARPGALSRLLTGDTSHADQLASSAEDLRRGRVAAHVAQLLSAAGRERWRRDLRAKLGRYPGRVHVIVGSEDPLTGEGRALVDTLGPRASVSTIAGAGHHPQLTDGEELARTIREHALGPHISADGGGSGWRALPR